MVILTKITKIKQPLYTLAAFSSLTGGSKIGDYLRGLGVLRGLGLREAFEMSPLSKELRYLFTSIFKYNNNTASFSQATKGQSRQAQNDHEQLQEISEFGFGNVNPNLGTCSNQEEFACAAVHCQPPPGIVNWSLDSND